MLSGANVWKRKETTRVQDKERVAKSCPLFQDTNIIKTAMLCDTVVIAVRRTCCSNGQNVMARDGDAQAQVVAEVVKRRPRTKTSSFDPEL